jgi:hypothetical protein
MVTIAPVATDSPVYKNIGTHATHCCSQHGCAYSGMGDKPCAVKDGVVEQEYGCERCLSTKAIQEQIAWLQKELVWSQKMEAKGLLLSDEAYAY